MIKIYKFNLIVLALWLLNCLTIQAQTKRFVDKDAAAGAQTGASWSDAYIDLQTAINSSAEGDSVFVKKGNYVLTSPINMKEGVKIYGSFTGTEDNLFQRKIGSTTADSTVLDGDNKLAIIVQNNAAGSPMSREAVLDGFVITGASFAKNADGGFPSDGGGGIYLNFASPTLQNLIIRDNYSAIDGAGIYMEESSSPILTNVIISGNKANRHAGAIFIRVFSDPILTNVLMSGNSASTGFGGAMMIDSRYDAANAHKGSNPVFTNVTISGNASKNEGGAVYVRGSTTVPKFRNSIILNNSSNKSASESGVSYNANSKSANEAAQPYNYCIVQEADLAGNPIYASGTNISSDGVTAEQVFINPAAATLTNSTAGGDFRLKIDNNPAINAGHSAYYDAGKDPDLLHIKTDLVGGKRIAKASVDLGAYEVQNQLPVASEVVFTGKLEVESTLTGSFEWDDDDAGDTQSGSTYAWYRADDAAGTNAEPIPNATSIEYIAQPADQDKYIAFEVVPGDGEGFGSPVKSAYAKINAKNVPPTASNVSIVGTLKIGEKLTGHAEFNDANANDSESGSTYVWYRADDESGANAAPIENATSIEYTVKVEDQGKYLAFEITPKDGKEFGEPVKSAWTKINEPVAGNTPPTASEVSISGTLEVGQTLKGNYKWNDEDDGDTNTGSTYAWYRADDNTGAAAVQISNAVGEEYVLQVADQGKFIRFEVIPNDGKSYGPAAVSDWEGPVVGKAEITFAAKDNKIDKVYGDGDFSSGATSNSDATITYSSDNTNVATVNSSGQIHIVGIGTANITASQAANESWSAASKTLLLTVAKKELTIVFNGEVSKVYDGNTTADLTNLQYTLNGKVGTDQVSLNSASAAATYDNKNVGTGKTLNISGLTLNGTDKDKYTLPSNQTISVTIGKITAKTVTLSVSGTYSKTYDGTVEVPLTNFAYTLDGVLSTENVTLNTEAISVTYDNKNAGTGKTITVSNLSLSGETKNNYAFSSASAETKGSITPKALTVTVESRKKEDSEPDPVFTVFFDGFVKGEDQSVLGGKLTFTRSQGNSVGVYTVKASGYSSDNYEITYVDGTLEIFDNGTGGNNGITGGDVLVKAENFFTPNGDGINDEWVVADVETFPSHSLLILDRGGRKVYEAKNYSNDWTGTIEGAFLQEGTYYYIFRFDDPKIAPKKGYITILRK